VIERRQGASSWIALATQPASRNYFTDDTVLSGTAYSYRVRAVNAGGVSAYSPTTTSVTWTQIEEWLLINFGSPVALTGEALRAQGSDGTRPLLRFAFNLTATEPPRTLVPGQSISGFPAMWLDSARNRLCVEFVRRKASSNPGVAYEVQFCNALPHWSTGGTQISAISIDSIWERVRYEDPLDASQSQSRFLQVIVREQ